MLDPQHRGEDTVSVRSRPDPPVPEDRSVVRLQVARGLISTSATVDRIVVDVDLLWRSSTGLDPELAGRLADVSHLLRRAARLLDGPSGIG